MKFIGVLIFCFFYFNGASQQMAILKYGDIYLLKNQAALDSCIKLSFSNQNDELKNYLVIQKTRLVSYLPYDSVVQYKIEQLAKKLNNENVLLINKMLAIQNLVEKSFVKDETAQICNDLVVAFKRLQDTTAIINCYFLLIRINTLGIGNFPNDKEILSQYIQVIKNFIQHNNRIEDRLIYYRAQLQYEQLINNCGNTKTLFDSTKAIARRNTFYQTYYSFIYNNYANCLYLSQNYTVALPIYTNLIKQYPFPKSLHVAKCLANVARCYFGLNKIDSAIYYYNQSIYLLQQQFSSHLSLLHDSYEDIASFYEAAGNYQQAYIHISLANSIFKEKIKVDRENLFRDLQQKYLTNEKELQNKQLASEKKALYLFMVIVLLLLLALLILLFFLVKQSKKIKKLALMREKVISIISHDLRSPLIALQGLSNLASFYLRKNEFAKFNKVAADIDMASNSITNLTSNLLIWVQDQSKTKFKQEKQFGSVIDVMASTIHLYQHVLQAKNITVQIHSTEEMQIVKANEKVLQLIARNWLDNTIKYANATTINIYLQNNAPQVLFVDDGKIAIDVIQKINRQLKQPNHIYTQNSSGLGFNLMAAYALQEKYNLELKEDSGKNVFSISW